MPPCIVNIRSRVWDIRSFAFAALTSRLNNTASYPKLRRLQFLGDGYNYVDLARVLKESATATRSFARLYLACAARDITVLLEEVSPYDDPEICAAIIAAKASLGARSVL